MGIFLYIRNYKEKDETCWVHCRALSFLDTAYFDNVLRVKEKYKNSAVELVAVENKQIIGLIGVKCESQKGSVVPIWRMGSGV